MNLGYLLIIIGGVLVVLGLSFSGMLGPLGQLPGDITIKRQSAVIYIPVTTMILISALISLVLWLFSGRGQ